MRRILTTAALAAAALTCSATPALAADEYTTEQVAPSWTAASAQSCADPDTSPLLSGFKDSDFYAVAPGGDFETGAAGWQLDGGAAIAASSGGLLGASNGALALPLGASATSPTFCVDERYPHFRLAYAPGTSTVDTTMRVDVLYPGLQKDNVHKATDLKAKHDKSWALSDRIKLDPLRGLRKGAGWRLVALRLSVTDGKPGAMVHVDDVLIDPRARA
jgi:hypothetical protein